MWIPDVRKKPGPVYLSIADALERDVASGRIAPGERLPTHRELARRLEINVMTVTRAFAEAARRGLVEAEVGRGTFVRRREARGFLPPAEERAIVDFDFNLPHGDEELLDPAPVLVDVARGAGSSFVHADYSAKGLLAHRAAGAGWMRRSGLKADPERTILTGGAQHAMTVALATLAAPGDPILAEELTFPGMKALASLLHLKTIGVAMDDRGILPDALDEACRKTGARVLYTMPTLHNPTGIVMPAARRREVAAVARRRGLAVVEDDSYGFFRADAPPPLAALLPERGYYLTSTSKSLAAGIRIGFLHAPEGDAVERLAATVAGLTWMAAPLMAEIAARWIAGGAADTMVAWKRREAAARRAIFDAAVGRRGATPSDPQSPHVWLPLPAPWRADGFVAEARRRGVAVTAAEAFVTGRGAAPHAVRVCLTTPPERGAVEKGVQSLARVLAGAPRSGRSLV